MGTQFLFFFPRTGCAIEPVPDVQAVPLPEKLDGINIIRFEEAGEDLHFENPLFCLDR